MDMFNMPTKLTPARISMTTRARCLPFINTRRQSYIGSQIHIRIQTKEKTKMGPKRMTTHT